MDLITVDLIDGFLDVDAGTLQFDLHDGKAVTEDGHVIPVGILPCDGNLVRYLIDVLGVVGGNKFEIDRGAVVPVKDELVTELFCALEHAFSGKEVEKAREFRVGEVFVPEGFRIEPVDLNAEVRHKGVVIRDLDGRVAESLQLVKKALFESSFTLISHRSVFSFALLLLIILLNTV